MCYQINYMLPCEHVRTHIVYCADAPPASTASELPSSTAGPRSERRSKGPKSSSKSRGGGGGGAHERHGSSMLGFDLLPNNDSPATVQKPDAADAARCPFEEKNRCWNCCWCGKQGNDTGRCRCVMIIEGNHVECEHICCGNCTAA
ncbi:hypothetical protein MAPG_04721 [Magnaporthiopsis poae ATCC 64411]|uniref:Uncharacterized protein n=1 Tax=Magnaporthiopsis poae (strain ATCC 64411 / 73-15) TaxID=644358 RepID=A0A0C4DXG8_MAGP6|nr:hypothetical protein MAPG_04721 [Magnaporthiopsis poae ATCC 64411]